jgi:hypothetical protein
MDENANHVVTIVVEQRETLQRISTHRSWPSSAILARPSAGSAGADTQIVRAVRAILRRR